MPLATAPAPLGRGRSLRRLIIPASAIAVLCIVLGAWWVWPERAPPPPAARQREAPVATAVANTPAPRLSFVVLPFENLSRHPDQEYFADGITDDLTTDLSRISGSFVIARTTAFTYKGKPTEARQIGRELGVRYVIEGSVRRSGDEVQVNVQLIDAETGSHVWADGFDSDLASLSEAQSDITGRLARTLNVALMEAGAGRLDREKGANPGARDLVMRGWAWFFRPASVETYRQAEQAFEKALEIDPRSINASVGLGQTLVTNLAKGWSSSTKQDLARAEQLLLGAIELDANNSQAHLAMGLVRVLSNSPVDGQAEYETALALDRNNWLALRGLALAQFFLGRPDAAIPYMEKAIRLSPRDPFIAENYALLGFCNLLLGDVDRAIDLLRRARAALGLRGDIDEAKAALAEAMKIKPEVNSQARWREYSPWITNPPHWALREKTLNVGLRRAGFPDG